MEQPSQLPLLAPEEPNGEDLALLIDAVAKAGQVALSHYGKSPEINQKSDGTLVSEADLGADAVLRKTLLDARPHYGWLSEESGHDKSKHASPFTWVVDPIDGTRAFLNEIPDWTISAALLDGADPVLAAVFNPVREEFYRAGLGQGVHRNDALIRVSGRTLLEGARLAVSKTMLEHDIWRQHWPKYEQVWTKSIAYRLALTAAGDFDAAIFNMGHDWDIAAAQLLVEEAGGLVTSASGARLRYDGSIALQAVMIAAGPALHADLLARAGAPLHQPN